MNTFNPMNGRVAACLAIAFFGAGCSLITETPGLEGTEELELAPGVLVQSLQDRLNGFNRRFSLRIQRAANEIAEKASEARYRKRAVTWKLAVIPYCRDAVFQQDPIGSLLDTWVLCVQMHDFFHDGAGTGEFGDATGVARTAAKDLEADIESTAKDVLPPDKFPQAQQTVTHFADEHPMQESFARMSMRPYISNAIREDGLRWILDTSLAPLRAIGGMDETARAIHEMAVVGEKLSTVIELLPEQVRWHAQLMLFDLEAHETVATSVSSFGTLAESAADLAETAGTLPAELRTELEGVLDAVEEKQSGLRETLKEAQTTLAEAEETAGELDTTAAAVAKAGRAWEKTLAVLGKLVEDLSPDGKPEPEAEEPGPSGVERVGTTARQIEKAATALHSATAEFQSLIASDQTSGTVEAAAAAARGLLIYAACLCGGLIVLFFGLLLAYRSLSNRVKR